MYEATVPSRLASFRSKNGEPEGAEGSSLLFICRRLRYLIFGIVEFFRDAVARTEICYYSSVSAHKSQRWN